MRSPKLFLWAEWLCLFLGVPLLAYAEWLPVSKFLIFSLPVLYALAVYRLQPATGGQRCSAKPQAAERPVLAALARTAAGWPRYLLLRAALISALLVLLARLMVGDAWFSLPRYRTDLWLLIMCLYPLLSALPQEFLYRRFYLWRYPTLFPDAGISSTGWLLLSNAIVFSLLHLMYDNALALILTFVGGAMFAWSYQHSGKLRWVWLEHAIYGQVIFTTGLGRYFYEPTPVF